ncbi:MAG: S24 family peptidase, partial [Cyanobacteria bacterium J06635_15]
RTANVSLEWLVSGQTEAKNSVAIAEKYIYQEPLAFDKNWLKSELSESCEHLLLTQVNDDSMEPTLVVGDLILADTNCRDLAAIAHGLFLFKLGDQILVKRLQSLPNKVIRVLSDNPAYEAFSLDLSDKSNGLSLMGRVVWVGHKL